MADVDLSLSNLAFPELSQLAVRIVGALESNPNFPSPEPPVCEVRKLIDELEAIQTEYREQRLRLNGIREERELRAKRLMHALDTLGVYVQETSGGDAAKILSAAMSVEHNTHFWHYSGLRPVLEVGASSGDLPGEVDLVWDPVRGVDGYEVETTSDAGGAGPWVRCAVSTQSRATVNGLMPRVRYWFRVRAVKDEDVGDWSDPVTKYTG